MKAYIKRYLYLTFIHCLDISLWQTLIIAILVLPTCQKKNKIIDFVADFLISTK